MVKATFVRTVASSVTYDEATISGFRQILSVAKATEISTLTKAYEKKILLIFHESFGPSLERDNRLLRLFYGRIS